MSKASGFFRSSRFPGLVEALCIIGLAAFLVYLLTLGSYWMYLNPKFRGLSWASAVALGAMGVYSLVRPPAGANWLRASLYVLVVVLCLVSEVGIQSWFAVSGVDTAAVEEQPELIEPRVSLGGVEYVRINLGELYDIATNRMPGKMDLNYAVRGYVRRSPELDARGEFVLHRLALYCCFADSTAVGFRVRVPKGQPLPDHGAWQVVYGRLVESKDDEAAAAQSIDGSVFASVQPDYALEASRVEAAKAPGMGMMYEWRREEPYAY